MSLFDIQLNSFLFLDSLNKIEIDNVCYLGFFLVFPNHKFKIWRYKITLKKK